LESCWSWVSVAILLTPVTVKRTLAPELRVEEMRIQQ
jgi:hypothetical protein